jgi:hypothetical protein
MDWENLPFDHSGRWSKTVNSPMNPGAKITWPQFIMEAIVINRRKYWRVPKWQSIRMGDGWSKAISKDIRGLCQQTSALCNYFPHPDDDLAVKEGFLHYLRTFRPTKIGQFRKHRKSITQDEKDFVVGVTEQIEKARKARPQETTKKEEETKPVELKVGPVNSLLSHKTKSKKKTLGVANLFMAK